MEDYLVLGDEYDFAMSFDSAEQVFDFLLELHEEFGLLDITGIKQAFINFERHVFYMECVRFEETYLKE